MISPIKNKKVLVAPLDWGLGHATRCIPIIKVLLQQNNQVIIAADGVIKDFLQTEFPAIQFISLFNYNINYSKNGKWLWLKMLWQIPPILYCIGKENKWLQQFVVSKKIDVVISDNRYGLHTKHCESIFITHQLRLKIPTPFKLFEPVSEWLIINFIKKYHQCWIPDWANETENLSGALSHLKKLPKNISFIGALSRFSDMHAESIIHCDVLILLSGPEPQRSILEEKILLQLQQIHTTLKIVMVGGKKQEVKNISHLNFKYFPILHSAELLCYLMGATTIICRSGYSTIMDLDVLKKTAIFIPTPGQTEQEYLARWMHKRSKGFYIEQNKFQLSKFIK